MSIVSVSYRIENPVGEVWELQIEDAMAIRDALNAALPVERKRRKVSDKPAPKAPDIAQKPSRRPTKATAEIHHPTVKDSPPGEPISDFPPDRKPDAFVLGPKGETVHCWWVSDGKEARVDALIKGKPMGESKWRLIAEPFVLIDVVYGLYNWQRVEGADGAQKESVAPQAQ
jgi:hypothetical protein